MKDRFLGGIIPEGTIFEGTEKTLPKFVVSEIREKRATFEILPESKKKINKAKKAEAKKEASVSKSVPKKEPASLREKLTKTEN